MSNAPLFLFAEDDDEDWMLIEDSFRAYTSPCSFERVKDGEELLGRLRDEDKPAPDLVLLDLKMPRKNGLEALREMRQDQSLRHIPVVVMTSSMSEADIISSYLGGASSYVAKPVSDDKMRLVKKYWSDAVELPRRRMVRAAALKAEGQEQS